MRRNIKFTHWSDEAGNQYRAGVSYPSIDSGRGDADGSRDVPDRAFSQHEANLLRAHVGARRLTPHYSEA